MDIQSQEGFKLQESAVAISAYADDVVLMSKLHDNLKSLFTRLEEKAKKVGLQVNDEKTEHMVLGRRDSAFVFPHLKVGRCEFSSAKQVKYLGSILTEKNETVKEIASKILSGNKWTHKNTKITISVNRNEDTTIYNLNMPSYHLWG